jgi:hypothetical protein
MLRRQLTENLKENVMKKALSIAALLLTSLTGTALADSAYSLAINAPSAKTSSKAVAKITVQPKGKFHINQEFPTKLTLEASNGVKLEKAKWTAKDAVKFENTTAEFEIAFTPESRGKKTFTGELKFAVCEGEESCIPKNEKISFTVDVK